MVKINDLRLKIDDIDKKILELIRDRLILVSKIGKIKKENGIDIVDKKREEEVMEELLREAEMKGLSPEIVKKVWKVLMEISYKIEEGKNGNS